jgi:negative regulator of sigma E activity
MNEMLKCDDVQELLSAYIDNELADDERRRVGAHLDGCAECSAAVMVLQDAIAAVKHLDDLEVPSELASSLRHIEHGKRGPAIPAKRWWATPRVAAFIATGAVAAIALVSLLTLSDMNIMGVQTSAEKAASPARDQAIEQQTNRAVETQDLKAKTEAHDIDSAAPKSGGAQSLQDYSLQSPKDGAASDELLLRGLPDGASGFAGQAWPKVLASNKNYSVASAESLLNDIHEKTGGLYTVADAGESRAKIVDEVLREVSAQGGEGERVRAPLNAILDRTKRAALPVYIEKAKFEGKPCLLIVIKWGFGGDENRLYKTSLYVTDLSGWTIFHYASK